MMILSTVLIGPNNSFNQMSLLFQNLLFYSIFIININHYQVYCLIWWDSLLLSPAIVPATIKQVDDKLQNIFGFFNLL